MTDITIWKHIADGHWWPETYYLGTIQAREVLYEVLAEYVQKGDLTEAQAVGVAQRSLFDNSNRLYGLKLKPDLAIGRDGALRWMSEEVVSLSIK